MAYRILADGILMIHVAWVLFVCFGLAIAWKRPEFAWIHLAALVFALLLNLMGWYCPLTYLENYLDVLQNPEAGYHDSFVAHHLVPLVYPDLPEKMIRIGVSLFVIANLAGHGMLYCRRRREWTGEGGSQNKGEKRG